MESGCGAGGVGEATWVALLKSYFGSKKEGRGVLLKPSSFSIFKVVIKASCSKLISSNIREEHRTEKTAKNGLILTSGDEKS